MPISIQQKREAALLIIDGLELLRDDARVTVEALQDAEAYPPEVEVDDVIDQVIDIVNCVDHELKQRL